MKRLLATPISTIIVLFLLTAPAFGQISKDGELNFFFGAAKHTANDFQIGPPQATPPINARIQFTHALLGGVRLNVANHGHWGEEFFYSYEQNAAHYRNNKQIKEANLPLQLHRLGITGLYYLDDNEKATTRPFFSFGLGASIYKPTQEARNSAADPTQGNLPGFGQANELTFHYGAGFKQRLGKAVGFRMDVRGFVGRYPSFNMSRHSNDPAAFVFPATGAIHTAEVTGGLLFYFGR